jgi:hypothetical protein
MNKLPIFIKVRDGSTCILRKTLSIEAKYAKANGYYFIHVSQFAELKWGFLIGYYYPIQRYWHISPFLCTIFPNFCTILSGYISTNIEVSFAIFKIEQLHIFIGFYLRI